MQPFEKKSCFSQEDETIIKNYEPWFKFFTKLPLIIAIFWAVLCIALGIILAYAFDENYILIMIGALFSPILYVIVKLCTSYSILHIYYLKKISCQGSATNIALNEYPTPYEIKEDNTSAPEQKIEPVATQPNIDLSQILNALKSNITLIINILAIVTSIVGFFMLFANVWDDPKYYDVVGFNGFYLLSFDTHYLDDVTAILLGVFSLIQLIMPIITIIVIGYSIYKKANSNKVAVVSTYAILIGAITYMIEGFVWSAIEGCGGFGGWLPVILIIILTCIISILAYNKKKTAQ